LIRKNHRTCPFHLLLSSCGLGGCFFFTFFCGRSMMWCAAPTFAAASVLVVAAAAAVRYRNAADTPKAAGVSM
jgi:hypothetical protein